VVAGLSAAGLPWWYQPWGIPTALFAAGVTLLWGLGTTEHRRPFVYAGLIAGVVFGLESIAYLLHEKSYYEALADTAYPGDRRDLGGGTSFAKLFTSIFPFELAGSHGNDVAAENLSEISMGWTLALPVSVAAVALARRSILRSREAVLLFGTTMLAVVIGSWAVVRWPGVFGKLTLLTFSPPARVAPFIGFFGVVTLALLLATPARRERVRLDLGKSGAVVIGVGVAVAVTWAGSEFRTTYLPDLSNRQVYGAALVSGVLAALLFTRRWAWALGAATTVAVVSGLLVNPLAHGLGALDDSPAAKLIRRVDRQVVKPANGTWAADTVYGIGLLNGEGVTSLTSYNDPVDEAGWRVLDPTGRYEGVWNRFGYIIFDWRPGLEQPQITAPVDDQVYVIADPCDPRLDRLHLRAIVSSHPLDDSACLRPVRRFQWMQEDLHVYERAPVRQR
jgi:hypothetical protein